MYLCICFCVGTTGPWHVWHEWPSLPKNVHPLRYVIYYFETFYGQFIVIKIRVKMSEKYATDK